MPGLSDNMVDQLGIIDMARIIEDWETARAAKPAGRLVAGGLSI